jgi:hypothetical protein
MLYVAVAVEVSGAQRQRPVSFVRDVQPLFAYVVETERRFYLANHVDRSVRNVGRVAPRSGKRQDRTAIPW